MAHNVAFLNGGAADLALAANRGLAYGDGLYETVLVTAEGPLWIEEHLERLAAGAQRLQLDVDFAALRAEIRTFCGFVTGRQVLKILCYRRSGGRGYQPNSRDTERLLSLWPAPDNSLWLRGATLMLCQTKMAINSLLAGVKHCNRLEQVLAADELARSGCDEGLMLDTSGRLIEGTRSNLFVMRQGQLYTPSLSESGVAGIMRDQVMQWAKAQGIRCREMTVGPSILHHADEIFVCNSVFGLWPVTAVGCLRKPPGPVCRALQAYFEPHFHA